MELWIRRVLIGLSLASALVAFALAFFRPLISFALIALAYFFFLITKEL